MFADRTPVRKDSEAASLISVESASSVTQGTRPPTSMPVPSAPRRAAPPRKKIAKMPSLPMESPPEAAKVVPEPSHDHPEELPAEIEAQVPHEQTIVKEESISVNPSSEDNLDIEGQEEDPHVTETPEQPPAAEPEASNIPPPDEHVEESSPATVDHIAESEPDVPLQEPSPVAAVAEPEENTAAPAEEVEPNLDEEDEAARRQRVAERLAKMGAFNPFGPRPPRQASVSSSPEVSNDVSAIVEEHHDVTAAEAPPPPPEVLELPPVISEESQALDDGAQAESEGSDYGGEGSENGKY
jgi:myosin tail region-interacting protein MTI1